MVKVGTACPLLFLMLELMPEDFKGSPVALVPFCTFPMVASRGAMGTFYWNSFLLPYWGGGGGGYSWPQGLMLFVRWGIADASTGAPSQSIPAHSQPGSATLGAHSKHCLPCIDPVLPSTHQSEHQLLPPAANRRFICVTHYPACRDQRLIFPA